MFAGHKVLTDVARQHDRILREYEQARLGLVRDDAPETSRAAAVAVWPTTGTKRAAVLYAIAERGGYGATDEEIQMARGMSGDTVRPRRVELVRGGWVEDSGTTRPTSAGNGATVWIVSGAGRMELARRT